MKKFVSLILSISLIIGLFTICSFNVFAKADSITLESIGFRTFSDCRNLTSITIPKSVESIGEAAFNNCGKLKKIYYYGSKKQWKKIVINNKFWLGIGVEVAKVIYKK